MYVTLLVDVVICDMLDAVLHSGCGSHGLLSGTEDIYSGAGSESDSSDHLIVDESKAQRLQLERGSLKMRLPGKAAVVYISVITALIWNNTSQVCFTLQHFLWTV